MFYFTAACSQNVSLLLHEVVAIRQPLSESDSAEGHFTNSRRGVRVVNLYVQSGYHVSQVSLIVLPVPLVGQRPVLDEGKW